MAIFIDVNDLEGRGFRMVGATIGDQTGFSVSDAGDVNGDGFDDIIVGAPRGTRGGGNAGEAYVIFGKASGFGTIDFGAFAEPAGFVIRAGVGDLAGTSVSSAGDFNGDGFADVVIGAPFDSFGSAGGGGAYIVLGKAGGFGTINLFEASSPDWIRIEGDNTPGFEGGSVSSAGDVNGDGFDDVIIGARANDEGGVNAGKAYVVFGRAANPGAIDLGSLPAFSGFAIIGEGSDHLIGDFISNAGDINGDGYDDIVVGTKLQESVGRRGAVYVIFGKGGARGTIDLEFFDSSDGFIVNGPFFDAFAGLVGSAGDFNGDGLADIAISMTGNRTSSEPKNSVYILFGKSGGFGRVDLAAITPATGFIIKGGSRFEAGQSVSAAGDVNGDGFDDIIIGGSDASRPLDGAAFVVYGRSSGFETLDISAGISSADGFTILGDAPQGFLGTSVSAAGDVNNDGFDDVIVGAPHLAQDAPAPGEAFVIFGAAPTESVTRIGSLIGQTIRGGPGDDFLDGRDGDDRLVGDAGADRLVGGSGADLLEAGDDDDDLAGGSGGDTLFGGGGDDVVKGEGGGDDVNGGDGDDTLSGGSGNDIVSGGNGADDLIGGSGDDELDGGAGSDVMRGGSGNDSYILSGTGDRIIEDADAGVDTVLAPFSYTLAANLENLVLSGSATSGTGNSLANLIVGNSAANALTGGGGNDTLRGGAGADSLRGGTGNDSYVVDNAGDKVIELAGQGVDGVSSSVSFTLPVNVENLTLTAAAPEGIGNVHPNAITGNNAANILRGGDSADTLKGAGGGDSLYGGNGSDTLSGGSGSDRFVFMNSLGAANVDHVTDFVPGADKIVLENAVFKGLAAGPLVPGAFAVGSSAGDPGDRIVYNPATGALFYDPDGNGVKAAVQFAVLDNRPANLAASDFEVI